MAEVKLEWRETTPDPAFVANHKCLGGRNVRTFVAAADGGLVRATTSDDPAGPGGQYLFHLSVSFSELGGHEHPPTCSTADAYALDAVRRFFGHKNWEEYGSGVVRHFWRKAT